MLFPSHDPTGILTWKPNNNYPPWWNTRYSGTSPKSKDKLGYLRAKITRNNKSSYVSCHRICFFIYHGWLPELIDHINGDVSYNRISNLRASNAQNNALNRKGNSKTKTGLKGVSVIYQRDGKSICGYTARSRICNKNKYLGFFKSKEAAGQAIIDYERNLIGSLSRYARED